ncbi:hypothetical protein E2C01_017056 [Portunus trituberculatus]|uniref:Uncharacterized protein n=1 Tax=Portunus trituberculatus TaxID=210409 RepID=A0A5B7DSS6_PORTR|nr:hypothetical protein [Portunus trituberculatus]
MVPQPVRHVRLAAEASPALLSPFRTCTLTNASTFPCSSVIHNELKEEEITPVVRPAWRRRRPLTDRD